MKITNLDEVTKVQVDMEGAKNVKKQVPISESDGSPLFAFRVFTVEPDGHTPYHQHPFEHINYVIEGNGALVTENGEELAMKTGDFALVLPDEVHQFKNTVSDKPFIIICAVPKEYE